MGGAIYSAGDKTTSICGTENIANALGNQFAANNKLSSEMQSDAKTVVENECSIL